MSVRKTRRPLAFEALERRETPSAGLGGGIEHVVRPPRPIAFRATATVTLTSETTGTITNGHSAQLGAFTGTFSTTGVATLTGTSGTLDLSATAILGKPRRGMEAFHGTFKILDGTVGQTNVAGGQGTIAGTLRVSSQSGLVTISGRVIP